VTVLLLEDFGMLRHGEWQILAEVSKDLNVFIVRIKRASFLRVWKENWLLRSLFGLTAEK
jgi:hypothetical protein